MSFLKWAPAPFCKTFMDIEHPLRGHTVLVTRPAGQGERLTQQLRHQGALVEHVPLLDIQSIEPDEPSRQAIMHLDRFDTLIFISTNAARWGIHAIDSYWPQWPVGQAILAVGQSTAAILEAKGLRVVTPAQESSEGLLALPELNGDAHRVLIVRGQGGREALSEQLQRRGATVQYAEVYRRQMPEAVQQRLMALLRTARLDVVLITSAEALGYWLECAGDYALVPWLLVASSRLADIARTRGARRLIVSEGARDDDVVRALQQWVKNQAAASA